MAWIKRNLFFVISVVIGLGVTGYCGFLLYTALGSNKEAREKYNESANRLKELQAKNPAPNNANITAAKEDQKRARQFLADFQKAFADFATPPKLDARGFQYYLQQTINEFGLEATNAGVGLNPGYGFAFREQMAKLSYAPENIGPWMQQLEEMKAILRILYESKINFLEHIRRPAISQDDGGEDVISFPPATKEWGTVTTYRLEFRGFSADVAAVLAGFAHSSNCFIVKTISVIKSVVPVETLAPPPPPAAPAPAQTYYRPMASPLPVNPFQQGGFGRGRPGLGGMMMPRPAPIPQQVPVAPVPLAPAGPEKILSESPLFVTIYVEVVKLKAPEVPKAAAAPGRAPRPRPTEH